MLVLWLVLGCGGDEPRAARSAAELARAQQAARRVAEQARALEVLTDELRPERRANPRPTAEVLDQLGRGTEELSAEVRELQIRVDAAEELLRR